MKKVTKMTIALTLLLLFLTAGFSLAMRHSGHSGHSGHGSSTSAAASGHDAHAGHGAQAGGSAHDRMEMLGNQVREGVRATAQISDISAAMAAAGMAQTHHLMVSFAPESGGSAISSGRVAVRVVTPSGKTLTAVTLQGMDGEFGGDVELKEKGEYSLQVGTQLADGNTRQFEFQYEVK